VLLTILFYSFTVDLSIILDIIDCFELFEQKFSVTGFASIVRRNGGNIPVQLDPLQTPSQSMRQG
jgi:hypothetical protein